MYERIRQMRESSSPNSSNSMRSNNNIAHKKVHTHSGQKTDDSS